MLAASVIVASQAHAANIICEVAPWNSGNTTVAADWIEGTHTGSSAVNIGDWKIDVNSNTRCWASVPVCARVRD
jgi:hypothetical protein